MGFAVLGSGAVIMDYRKFPPRPLLPTGNSCCDKRDLRIQELLEANNREVDRRRKAEDAIARWQSEAGRAWVTTRSDRNFAIACGGIVFFIGIVIGALIAGG